MPPLPDPKNVYSETGSDNFSPATAGALSRVYAPNLWTGKVDVIDPETFTVVDSFVAHPEPGTHRAVVGFADALGFRRHQLSRRTTPR